MLLLKTGTFLRHCQLKQLQNSGYADKYDVKAGCRRRNRVVVVRALLVKIKNRSRKQRHKLDEIGIV